MENRVRPGIEVLADNGHPLVKGRRIGLVTNPTGMTGRFESSADICAGLQGTQLTALFACEHGIRGQLQAGVRFGDEFDAKLGVPVFSLYGEHKKPTEEMLDTVDTVVFDIQDLGVRFYTYLSTLLYVMQSCAEHGKSLLILDRPNPVGGLRCEGGVLKPGFESMVGAWRMPIRTGLTLGELALRMNDELSRMDGRQNSAEVGARSAACQLDVVAMQGWTRGMEYTDTGLPWLPPSPNIPSMDTARVYPGTCLFEGTNLSEGRGTTKPFEWIGAPWIEGEALSRQLNAAGLAGVHFHPVYASPMFSKHKGELCGGVRLFVTDASKFKPVGTALHMLHHIGRQYPDRFEWLPPYREGGKPFIDLLTGGDELRTQIGTAEGLHGLLEAWDRDSARWREESAPYRLYG